MNNLCSEKSPSQFQRSRNVSRNMVYGFINRCFSLLLPFIVRTVLIYRFGTLYLGMNSLLASIFQVLNLAELGLGTAVVYSLYKPVAEEDTDTVCAYLGTYRKIYRCIGFVILAAGLFVLPLFPSLLKHTEVPDNMNIYVWYLLFLADAVVSYLLYGYKTAIPSALQRQDLLCKVDTVLLICKSLVQICCLVLTENFYLYLLASLVFTVLRNVLVSHLVARYYPQYVCRGFITATQFAELRELVYGLALSNFRGASRHAIDSICITLFVSLTMTAIYSNYFLIHNAVISLTGILNGAMVASVGNSIVTDGREKTYRDMRRFNFIYMILAGWAVICLLCIYQPFVKLWLGPNLMLGWPEVVALCLYFYVLKMGSMRWVYHQGAGLWWKARHFVIAEIVCNVVLNILLAKYWGVLGIILATLISLFFINFLGGAWVLFNEYFQNGKLGEFFADQILYFVVTVILAIICFWACEGASAWLLATGNGAGFVIPKSTGILDLLVRLVICSFVSVAGYFLAYCKTERFQDACSWVTERLRLVWTET